MFRVSKTEERSRTVVTIEGQLSDDSVVAAETVCEQAQSTGKPVEVFLRDVSTIDHAGRALLCRLAARGIRLLANGVYTGHIVRALSAASAGPRSPTTAATK